MYPTTEQKQSQKQKPCSALLYKTKLIPKAGLQTYSVTISELMMNHNLLLADVFGHG